MPVVAEINRNVPIRMNEGAGSLSILDLKSAKKYHLTSLDEFKEMIHSKAVTMVIFSDSYIHYFGKNSQQRDEVVREIKINYNLIKEFPINYLADSTSIHPLYIYRLPKTSL